NWQRAQNSIQSALPGTSRRLRSWLEIPLCDSTADSLCWQWCMHKESMALSSSLQRATRPMKSSKPFTSACTIGLADSNLHALAQRHPSDEVRWRTHISLCASWPLFVSHAHLHWKETRMRKTIPTQQPRESAPLPGVKKLLKVEEVADILGVSRVKVYLLL